MSAITELEELVTKAKDSYYNTGKFLKVSLKLKYKNAYMALVNADPKLWKDKVSAISITDELYDSIEDTLKSLKPKSKALTVGAPVTKQKVELPFFMGSLDKIKPGSVDKWLKTHKGPYIVMDKEDGLSIGMLDGIATEFLDGEMNPIQFDLFKPRQRKRIWAEV